MVAGSYASWSFLHSLLRKLDPMVICRCGYHTKLHSKDKAVAGRYSTPGQVTRPTTKHKGVL